MSKFTDDAAAVIVSHQNYFGESINYRATASDAWTEIADAIVHKEEVKERKTPTGWQRVTVRDVFVQQSQMVALKVGWQVEISETIYTVDGFTKRAAARGRVHLLRVGAMEVSRPNYRSR